MKDIAKLSNTNYLLDKYHLQASKKFGQNFLIDLNVIKKIVDSTPIDKNTCVIEIGPGIGALSEQLSYKAGKVLCFEIDERLKAVLNESLGEFDNIEIVFQDFLTVDFKKKVEELKQEYEKVCVVANLPYYITSDILEHIITAQSSLHSIHTMVQKEVALKLTDKNHKSPLIFMIESVGDIQLDMHISKKVFSPAPHVDSAIISIYINKIYNPLLTKILKYAFTQKRKTIYNNLKGLFLEKTKDILKECQIDEKKRPEELMIEDYIKLTKYL
ncbi:MAG: 16S rRNA (adenine(1518)-N(6)/adenine(1519)-N(6))-dimethyltransferase RsmA [Coprobacillus sp.]